MPLFHTILFPTDFSDSSKAMSVDVRNMAAACDAEVVVMHSFNAIPIYYLTGHMEASREGRPAPVPYAAWANDLRKKVQGRLENFAREFLPGIRSRVVLEDGEPAPMIACVAERLAADLIMIPTRGHGAFRRLLLGSVTAKVIHDVDCAVFTSAHELDPGTPRCAGFHTVLCALEWSEEAESILQLAFRFAKTWGSGISILHIAPRRAIPPGESAEELKFEELVRRIGLEGPIRIISDGVPEGIRSAAMEQSAELVIVGRGKARRGVSRLWSNLYGIIRESQCPVLSV